MKILLVRPAADTRYMSASYQVLRLEPLSLEYLAASVKGDHDVRLLDLRLSGEEELRRVIQSFQPQLIGTGGDSCEARACKRVLSVAKQLDPQILTVVGGIHATTLPQDFHHPAVDLVCVNEGVFAFREIVERLERGGGFGGVHGIAINASGAQRRTPERPLSELDQLPFPDRSVTAAYRRHYGFSPLSRQAALMRFTQGCVGRCEGCPSWAQTGKRYLRRSVAGAVEELKGVAEPYVYFACEESLLDSNLGLALAEEVIEQGLHKRFAMPMMADTIVEKPEVIEVWAEAGLQDAVVTLEPKDGRKGPWARWAEAEEALKILKANGISCIGSLVVRPDFTLDDFNGLVETTRRLEIDFPRFYVQTPVPGTELYRRSRPLLVEHDFDLWDGRHAVTPTRLPLPVFYDELKHAYRTHREAPVMAFYRQKLGPLTAAEMDEEIDALRTLYRVVGTLHEDHVRPELSALA
jgi:radical SAM superfamily enzyme YgiQ (UPF0313 family)